MNSKSIYTCQNCDQLFCAECSNADSPTDYCSSHCQIEKTALNEYAKEPLNFKLSGLKKPDIKKRLRKN